MTSHRNDKTVLIWDLPIRVFHWLFAGTISFALLFAIVGEHTPLFSWHMILGVYAGFLLLLRGALGTFGPQRNRLKAFLVSPVAAGRHVLELALGNSKRYAGHNPLATLSYVAMFVLLTLVILTGLFMETEFAEESHEFFAYALIGVIAAHLVGIALHTWLYRENIALSMVTGRKAAAPSEALASARPMIGVLTLATSLAVMGVLFTRFDAASRQLVLPITGTTITLAEDEDHEDESDWRGERERDSDEERHERDRDARD